MGRLKGVLLVALVVCYAMQVVVSQSYEERKEEERRAKEEDWRRREKTAEEERRHRRSWEEEEEERGRPGRRKWDEEGEEEERGWQPRPKPEPEPYGPGGRRREKEGMFLLRDSKNVISTQAGEMRVVKGYGGKIVESPLHIGFISMEPRSLFVPQYLDSSLIIFLRRGEAKLGFIFEDEPSERQLKMGDVYRIPAGSTFYIVNTGETQRLHIICSIDPSEGLGFGTFQSFFIGGGTNPVSVFAGFDPLTISTAFNVSIGELRGFMTGQEAGPIIFADTTHSPSLWANFLKLKGEERLERLKMVAPNAGSDEQKEKEPKKSWWNIFDSLLGTENKKGEKKGDTRTGSSPDSYNLLDRDPSFKNSYGWSIAVDKHEYHPLKKSGIGVYLVNLTAGSMMAPHVNPMATEYGIVLYGVGTIQVVFPNGTSAMNTNVKEGDVFWIPRYFPFCQIASRSGSFEFFGFTTSAHRNRPQFLVGASSILRSMRGPEFATAFGLTEDRYNEIVDAQREALILPSPSAASGDEREFKGKEAKQDERSESKGQEKKPDKKSESKEEEEKRPAIEQVPKFVRSLGAEMIMGFE